MFVAPDQKALEIFVHCVAALSEEELQPCLKNISNEFSGNKVNSLSASIKYNGFKIMPNVMRPTFILELQPMNIFIYKKSDNIQISTCYKVTSSLFLFCSNNCLKSKGVCRGSKDRGVVCCIDFKALEKNFIFLHWLIKIKLIGLCHEVKKVINLTIKM